MKAIENGQFATWPYLTVGNVRKNLPNYDDMVKVHMNQIRKNIRSTKPKVMAPTPEPDMAQEGKCRYFYVAIMETS
jgi:hypothetical protein